MPVFALLTAKPKISKVFLRYKRFDEDRENSKPKLALISAVRAYQLNWHSVQYISYYLYKTDLVEMACKDFTETLFPV